MNFSVETYHTGLTTGYDGTQHLTPHFKTTRRIID